MKSGYIKLVITRGAGYLGLLLVILSISLQQASAQKKPSKKEKHFEATISFATLYDDNILKYSDKYIERFLNHQDTGRFHIDTYDDIIFYESAELAATYRLIKNLKTRVNANLYSNIYAVNSIKNWYYFSLGIQQFMTKKASFKISYSYIPRYYVRHFRDEDWVDVYGYTPETFVPFSYAKDNYGFWIQNTFFKNTRLKLGFDYAQYYHNQHYTEYDCKNYIFGISLFQPLHEKVKIELGYEYEHSDAKGYDEPGETRESADDADATYNEYAFVFGLTWELPEIKKKAQELDLKLAYQKRYYLSEHYLEEDREHTGRVDDVVQFSVNYDISLSKAFTLGAFYRYAMRNSDSDSEINSLYLAAEKEYRQNQVGLQVTYNLKF
jgi:hypothetical protein